jgi:hypothetical protein
VYITSSVHEDSFKRSSQHEALSFVPLRFIIAVKMSRPGPSSGPQRGQTPTEEGESSAPSEVPTSNSAFRRFFRELTLRGSRTHRPELMNKLIESMHKQDDILAALTKRPSYLDKATQTEWPQVTETQDIGDQGDLGTLKRLPDELKLEIASWVAVIPAWVHLKFYSGSIVLEEEHRIASELRVSKGFRHYQDQLKKHTARSKAEDEWIQWVKSLLGKSPPVPSGQMCPSVQKFMEACEEIIKHDDFGVPNFTIQGLHGGPKSIPCKPALDYFFLDEVLKEIDRGNSPNLNFKNLSTIVLSLDDVHVCLHKHLKKGRNETVRWIDIDPSGGPGFEELDFFLQTIYATKVINAFGPLFGRRHRTATIKILVGPFCPALPPSELREIKAPQEGQQSTREETISISEEQEKMQFVERHLFGLFERIKVAQDNFLRTAEKEQFLKDVVSYEFEGGRTREWLMSLQGLQWLASDPGKEWLNRYDEAHMWLTHEDGAPFLETEQGLEWLEGDGSEGWLKSAHFVWWCLGKRARTNVQILDDAAFFKTRKGKKWHEYGQEWRKKVNEGTEMPGQPGRLDWVEGSGQPEPAWFRFRPPLYWSFVEFADRDQSSKERSDDPSPTDAEGPAGREAQGESKGKGKEEEEEEGEGRGKDEKKDKATKTSREKNTGKKGEKGQRDRERGGKETQGEVEGTEKRKGKGGGKNTAA